MDTPPPQTKNLGGGYSPEISTRCTHMCQESFGSHNRVTHICIIIGLLPHHTLELEDLQKTLVKVLFSDIVLVFLGGLPIGLKKGKGSPPSAPVFVLGLTSICLSLGPPWPFPNFKRFPFEWFNGNILCPRAEKSFKISVSEDRIWGFHNTIYYYYYNEKWRENNKIHKNPIHIHSLLLLLLLLLGAHT